MLKREYCPVTRYSVRWPCAVLPYGIAAKLVAMLFCVLVVRNIFSRSTNPPGVNTASPMLNDPAAPGSLSLVPGRLADRQRSRDWSCSQVPRSRELGYAWQRRSLLVIVRSRPTPLDRLSLAPLALQFLAVVPLPAVRFAQVLREERPTESQRLRCS